jgi:hypothetical protein
MDAPKTAAATLPPLTEPTGVRYLLREILDELEIERASGARGMEKLDRHEIRKLIAKKGDRRVRSSK